MDVVDFVIYALGFGLTSGVCTWVISQRAAFKKGLIVGLERGHREGFDVGYQAGVYGVAFGEEETVYNNLTQTEVVNQYSPWFDEKPSANKFVDSYEPVYEYKEVFTSFS